MDRKVVDALKALPERMRFVRGPRTFVGFRQTGSPTNGGARSAGSRSTRSGLDGLAMDGVVSFSSYPLRLLTYSRHLHGGPGRDPDAAGCSSTRSLNHTAPRGWASGS